MKVVSREEIENLVKMANRLDEEGRRVEAAALDLTIQKLVTAAEEDEKEEEKSARQLSNKAKSKIRAVCKAADSFVQANLDIRGEHKKHLRKLESLCEEICEIAKELKLDDSAE